MITISRPPPVSTTGAPGHGFCGKCAPPGTFCGKYAPARGISQDVCASGGLAQTCAQVAMFFPDLCASGDIPCRFVSVCRDFVSLAPTGDSPAGLRARTGFCHTRSPRTSLRPPDPHLNQDVGPVRGPAPSSLKTKARTRLFIRKHYPQGGALSSLLVIRRSLDPTPRAAQRPPRRTCRGICPPDSPHHVDEPYGS